MYEELPVPYGLVRYGVAPDHPEVKVRCVRATQRRKLTLQNCIHKFEETAMDPRFHFYGNAQIGAVDRTGFVPPEPDDDHFPTTQHAAQIPLDFLQRSYHAVLFAYGAAQDRPLGIAGEDLEGVHSARSFVHLYNGHPYAHLPTLDLSQVRRATIIGHGNVALDCARTLLAPVDELRKTDTPEPVLGMLAKSAIERVDVVGRRGPLQVSFTTKELRELVKLPNARMESIESSLLDEASSKLTDLQGARMKKRLLDLMRPQKDLNSDAERVWSLGFLRSPVEINARADDPKTVGSMKWAVNELQESSDDPLEAKAVATNETISTDADLVLKSVGYRSVGIEGLPFDERRGIVRNLEGRVVDANGSQMPGLYASGWLARGPTGVIATTMQDAYLTADLIAQDLATMELPEIDTARPEDIARGRRLVSWTDWQAIDNEEVRRGRELGKPREKITRIEDMLALLDR